VLISLPHSTYFMRQFLVFVLFADHCFGDIMCIRNSYVYQEVVRCFLFMKVMSGRLEGIILSVIMLPFQYSLKLPFSIIIIIIIIIRPKIMIYQSFMALIFSNFS
jgi:hypothetical protein